MGLVLEWFNGSTRKADDKFYLDLVAVRILYLQSLACLMYSPPASLVPHLRASVMVELRSSKQKDEERNQSPSDEMRRRGVG